MLRFTRVCVIGPDHWAGTLALAIRQYSPGVEVICVAGAEVGQQWVSSGVADSCVDSFLEGIHGSDILLLGTGENGSPWNLREVIISCDPRAVICGHGRTMTEVSRVVRELDRTDFHYVSVALGGSLDWGEALDGASADFFNGQRVSLSPLTIEDLNVFSLLSDMFRHCGATVIATSPQLHDRQMAEFVQLPQLVRIPFMRYLTNKLDATGTDTVAESYQLFGDFAAMGRSASEIWSSNLFHNKSNVLAALEGCQQQLAALIGELTQDKMHEIASSTHRQANELKSLTNPAGARLAALPPAAMEASPEALVEMLESAIKVVKRMPVRQGVSVQSLYELIENTRRTVEDILRAQAVEPERTGRGEISTLAAAHESQDSAPSVSAPETSAEQRPDAHHGWVSDDYGSLSAGFGDSAVGTGSSDLAPASVEAEQDLSPTFSISCGHDVHTLQTAAQLLTQNRIEIERIDREETPSGLTLWVTLTKREQVIRAKELLRGADVPVG
ncbi:prephenate dehydrogenase/arogenate dehydrogenase family protein [candidate division KSB1 bacterium]|nr:prephenate dehydrogenase/arogenate dehydrogenase family protein [candidate division KSB1 bacterium]